MSELKHFNPAELLLLAPDILRRRSVAGTDRVGRLQFQANLPSEVAIINRKALAGTYRFSRYRSSLRLKTAGVEPRELSIPTYRDRLTLKALLRGIQEAAGPAIDRKIPNEKIRELKPAILLSSVAGHPAALPVARIDIRNFFPSMMHSRIRDLLAARISNTVFIDLVMTAVRTSTRSDAMSCCGVPQGISISSALADLYLADLGAAVAAMQVTMTRHVDDILIVGQDAHAAFDAVAARLSAIGLEVNEKKSIKCHLRDGVDYLGYHLSDRGLSVSQKSVQRLLSSISRIIGRYRDRSNTYARFSLTQPARRAVLLEEVNTRITGAISRHKQYGWIAYYSEADDFATLRSMDCAIESMVSRIPEFCTSPRR